MYVRGDFKPRQRKSELNRIKLLGDVVCLGNSDNHNRMMFETGQVPLLKSTDFT